MLRPAAHDASLAHASARLENPVATLDDIRQELAEMRATVERQRREIDLACRELTRQRDLLLQLLERLQVRTVTILVDGTMRSCTTSFADMVGRAPHQLREQSVLEYFGQGARQQLLSLFRECIKGRTAISLDSQLVIEGGAPTSVRLMMTLLPGWELAEQSLATELLLVISARFTEGSGDAPPPDTTAMCRAHEPSTVCTVANAGRESVTWIVGGLAHDFNNVLTTVSCHLSIALMDLPETSAVVETLRDATQAVVQATSVTRRLLDFARRRPHCPAPARVSSLVESLCQKLGGLLEDRASIVFQHDTDGGVINVDPHQFETVLTNLVLNARDAMPSGGVVGIETTNVVVVQKCLTTRPALVPGSYVVMRVIDHGSGMTPETMSRLFEPFFTTQSRDSHQGLGLAASEAAVRQASGGIEVSSALGQGTCVTVYWPRVLDGERAPLPVRVRANPEAGPATILVVEDDNTLRALGVRILGRLGYRVLSAANGIEALEVAAKHSGPIDLLFTDVVMPGMNGRELATRLRETRSEVKVLFTSGYTDHVFGDEPQRDRGPLDYLCKPYRPEALEGRIAAILQCRRD
jgi:CheY-like chemotaxis protein